jgi:hypothetical protein
MASELVDQRAEQAAFTIHQFCARNTISLATFHKLARQGRGPRVMNLGRAVRISSQAEADWQRERENPDEAEARLIKQEREARVAQTRAAGAAASASPAHVSKRSSRERA